MNQISIPKPCHENWDNMLPETQGKHCLACSKTVIDFSTWEQEDILNYLQNKNGERVCGRFNASQLEPASPPEKVLPLIFKSNVSVLKKMAAIILLCFGVMSGAESYGQQKIVGKPDHPKPAVETPAILGDTVVVDTANHPIIKVSCVNDTSKRQPQIMGMIAPPVKVIKIDTTKNIPIKKEKKSASNTSGKK